MRILLCAVLASGCSAIVGGAPLDPAPCQVIDGVDPCPVGRHCTSGFCVEATDGATCGMEVGCNGADEDCDGRIDEGDDADGDMFSWCDPDPSLRDCNDNNAQIHPAGHGVPAPPDLPCDGADNDCNGTVSECDTGQACDPTGVCRVPDCTFGAPCHSGFRCDTSQSPAACVMVTTDCMTSGCAPPAICDPISRACISALGLGQPCSADNQCTSKVCMPVNALGLRSSDVGGAAQVCGKACCSDSECDAGSLCWAPGTGARSCVPSSLLSMGGPLPSAMACASDTPCASGELCGAWLDDAYNVTSRLSLSCIPDSGAGGGFCVAHSDCGRQLCRADDSCIEPCRTNNDCLAGWEYCGDASFGDSMSSAQSIQVCNLTGSGTATDGDACGSASDCYDDACVNGTCAATCCAQTDCHSGGLCRPSLNGARWEMRCVH